MVDFAESDRSQSGVDARIEPQESVVQSILTAVRAASVDAMVDRETDVGASSGDVAPPLYEFVDPDALEGLYSHAQAHEETAHWTTTFRYADTDVSVTSAGTITVEPRDAPDANQRVHDCPSCEAASVDVSDDRFVVGATLQCPECSHEWDVSF